MASHGDFPSISAQPRMLRHTGRAETGTIIKTPTRSTAGHAFHRRTRISPITPVVGLSLPPLTAHSAPAEDSCSASADTEISLRCPSASVETTHGLLATGDPPVRVLAYAPSNGTKQRTKHVPGNQGCPQTMWGLGQLATTAPAINRKSLVFQGFTRILRG